MRPDTSPHITDSELLQAADGELSNRRVAEIEVHLAACWTCRSRRSAIENTIAEFIQGYEEEKSKSLPPIEPARFQFESRLAQLAENYRRSPLERAQTFFINLRNPAYIGAGVVLIVIYIIAAHIGTPHANAALIPDTRLTPGATRGVSRDDICAVGTIDAVPAVPSMLAQRVFDEYGIHSPPPRTFEVDYLITPALGGSADIQNLWPQPYAAGKWNSHVKDALEDRLRALVCEGKLDLVTAQHDISVNWIAAYKKYFKTSEPLEIHAGFALDPPWE